MNNTSTIAKPLVDPVVVSAATQTKLEDYYINLVAEATARYPFPPNYNIKPLADNIKPNCLVYVYISEHKHRVHNSVDGVTIVGSLNFRKEPYLKYIGKILARDYKELDYILDTALSEYRRKAFKKVSRKQRHLEGRNDS